MEHEITIEEKAVGTVTAYRGVCSCKTYHTSWAGGKIAASLYAITHLNDVEQANAHDIAP